MFEKRLTVKWEEQKHLRLIRISFVAKQLNFRDWIILSNVLCSCFEIKVYRNLRSEGYVSRMVEKWWCLHPLWRGNMWTVYSSTEDTSCGVRLPHELQWDKSPLLWGNEERSQNVISLVINRGVYRDSLVTQTVESLSEMWETQVGYMEKEMTTHSSMLAWKIPWVEEPGGL